MRCCCSSSRGISPSACATLPADVLTTLAQRVTRRLLSLVVRGHDVAGARCVCRTRRRARRAICRSPKCCEDKQRARADAAATACSRRRSSPSRRRRCASRNGIDLNAYYLIEQSGFDRKPPTEAIKQGLEVLREYTDASGKPLTQITMGQQVDVHLKFRGLEGATTSPSIALVDLLPGGFELVVPPQDAQTPFIEASERRRVTETTSAERTRGWRCQICVGAPNASLQYADMREDRVVFYVERQHGRVGDRLSHQGDQRRHLHRAARLRRGDVRPQRRRRARPPGRLTVSRP